MIGAVFHNYHGITSENLRAHLVDPYPVEIDPDDSLGTPPVTMWVVLDEHPGSTGHDRGYSVVYCPDPENLTPSQRERYLESSPELLWGVAEFGPDGRGVLVCGAESFAEALSHM